MVGLLIDLWLHINDKTTGMVHLTVLLGMDGGIDLIRPRNI